MNIYVPDDLADRIKGIDDVNVSAVCQEALRAELERRAALAKLGEGLERIKLYVDRSPYYEGDVTFTGRPVFEDKYYIAYITRRGRIAIYHNSTLDEYDTLEDLLPAMDDEPALIAAVAEALGKKYVAELDI